MDEQQLKRMERNKLEVAMTEYFRGKIFTIVDDSGWFSPSWEGRYCRVESVDLLYDSSSRPCIAFEFVMKENYNEDGPWFVYLDQVLFEPEYKEST